jgi:vesicle coat complex subunit
MSERTINFDTHRFVKRLVDSGLAEKTAEVLADEQSRLLTDNLATKADLETQLAAVKADLEVRLAESEVRTVRWMAGLLIAQGGVIVTLNSLLG